MCEAPNPDFIPRRLVDVGSENIEPHLIDTEDHGLSNYASAHFQYATLSYCWGPPEGTFVTVRANVTQNKQSIRLLALPHVRSPFGFPVMQWTI
jgi:hypothetical protein